MPYPPPPPSRHPRSTRLRGGAITGLLALALVAASAAAGGDAQAPAAAERLLGAERILVGVVASVTPEGDAGGTSAVRVVLRVSETLRGAGARDHVLRQSRREPAWTTGERVIVFLHRPDPLGFQEVVGGRLGKLVEHEGQVRNPFAPGGALAGVRVRATGLSLEQLAITGGIAEVVAGRDLLEILRRAIDERWLERGLLTSRSD